MRDFCNIDVLTGGRRHAVTRKGVQTGVANFTNFVTLNAGSAEGKQRQEG
jgi:hypothetical protein